MLVCEGLIDLCSPLQVKRTYSQGTYRAGAMRQVSLVGAVDEEVGDYFPEFISMLEESPFLEVSAFYSVCVCVYKHHQSKWMCKSASLVSHYVIWSIWPHVTAEDSSLGNVLQSAAAESHWEWRRPHHVGQTWRADDPHGRHAQITLQKETVGWGIDPLSVFKCYSITITAYQQITVVFCLVIRTFTKKNAFYFCYNCYAITKNWRRQKHLYNNK